MNVRKTFVVYVPEDSEMVPRYMGQSARDAWRKAAAQYCAVGFSGVKAWINSRKSAGWRCLRVVPEEGQT